MDQPVAAATLTRSKRERGEEATPGLPAPAHSPTLATLATPRWGSFAAARAPELTSRLHCPTVTPAIAVVASLQLARPESPRSPPLLSQGRAIGRNARRRSEKGQIGWTDVHELDTALENRGVVCSPSEWSLLALVAL